MDKDKREQLILGALLERRLTVEEVARQLRARAVELTRTDAELRDEVATLDAILGACVEPPPSPSAAVPVSTPTAGAPAVPVPEAVPASASLPSPPRKRRRKGSRMEETLPRIRAKFASTTFTTEDVTDLLMQFEGGEHRKAYFAAWSLVRDLAEDGVVAVVSEEGSGTRKKRTYRFAGPSATEGLPDKGSVEPPSGDPPAGLERDILRFVSKKRTVRAEELVLRFHEPPPETLANALLFLEKRGDVELVQGPTGVSVEERVIARVNLVDLAERTTERNEAFLARLADARRRDLERVERGSENRSR